MTATICDAHPSLEPSGSVTSNDLVGDQHRAVAQFHGVPDNSLAPGHDSADSHDVRAGGGTLPPTSDAPMPMPAASAASFSAPDPAPTVAQRTPVGGGNLQDALLGLAAETLSDIERIRVATENRLRAMRDDHDVADTPEYQRAEAILEALAAAEHQAARDLGRQLRQHPLGPWVKRTVGIGEKQGARLIAAIGDPYWNTLEDRPRRGPAELWAFCGYKPGQKRQKGVRSNWNSEAKMRAHLCAEAAIKAGVRKGEGCDDTGGYDFAHRHGITPYGAVYLKARASWADHDKTDGHKHNHALRCVAKRILRDLFLASREEA